MFDFDASKLLIIGVVALVVIGPKDLPRVLRQVGQMVGKLRRMAGEFQGQFMDAMKEADLQDLKKEMAGLKDTARLDVAFNPIADIRSELTKAVDGASASPASEPSASAAEPVAPIEGPAGGFGPLAPDHYKIAPPVFGDAPSAGSLAADTLTLAEPAHHTPAETSGAVDAVSAPDPAAGDAGKRRRIVVSKRRPPGDRMMPAGTAAATRGRAILPPRRDPRP